MNDAAKMIRLSPRRTWDLIRTKKIRSYKDQGRRYISPKALQEYVDSHEIYDDEEAAA